MNLSIKKNQVNEFVANIQKYLRLYGYLEFPNPDETSESGPCYFQLREDVGMFGDATSEALAKFQELQGLEITGEITLETLNLMSQPRCGCTDFRSDERNNMIDESQTKIETLIENICYGHAGGLGNLWKRNFTKITAVLARATSTWEPHVPYKFVDVKFLGNIPHQTKPCTHRLKLRDEENFSNKTQLAFAFGNPPKLGNDIKWNKTPQYPIGTDIKWHFGLNPNLPSNHVDFYSVALHEIGHMLGLWNHSSSRDSVMYAYFAVKETRRNLSDEDIERAVNAWNTLSRFKLGDS